MSQATHVGREATLEALGKTWRLSRWERHVWDEFLEWARPRIPDPLEVGKKALAIFPEKYHAHIVSQSIEMASYCLSSNSPQVRNLMGSIDGTCHLLLLLLKKHHPEIDENLAIMIAGEVGSERLEAAFERCAGKVPKAAAPNGQAPAE